MRLVMVKTLANTRLIMKNLYKIGMLAVAALAFASCNKEVDTQVSKGSHVVIVKATKDFDTRTAIDERADQAYFVWTSGDEAYFHIYENGIEATSVSMSVDEDGLATFTARFDDTEATSFEYTAKYFKEESNAHNPLIIANQKPTLTSYDPSADVLIAKPEPKDEPATELQFALRRVVSINKMTLKGLVEGEKISSVELASTDKNFSAYFVAASTEVGDDGTVTEKPENYSAAGKKLTFDYSELTGATVGSDGTFAVYFVSAPVEDATFSVKVTTDQNVYERTLTSKLTLVVGQVKRFGIQLGDYGTPISAGTVYTLVESNTDLYDGATYLVVAEKDGAYYAIGKQASNNRSGAAIPAPVNKTITVDNTYAPYPVKLTAAGQNWYIIDNYASSDKYGQYIYNASTTGNNAKSYLRSEETPDSGKKAEWSISIDDGEATINNIGNTDRGCLVMNYNSGNPLFNVYGAVGSYSTLALYVDLTTATSKETPTIVFDDPVTTVNVGEYVINIATIEPSTLSFTYSSEDTNIATVDETGKVTGVAAGTTTIKASFAGNEEYNPAFGFYEITVVDPNANDGSAEKPYTASEAIALAKTLGTNVIEGVYVKGIVCTTGSINATYGSVTYYISDDGSETSRLQIYGGLYIDGDQFTDETNLKYGDYVVVCGDLKYYNSSTPEIDKNSEIKTIFRAPSFDPDGGTFTTETLTVEISAETGATIRYTLDGSKPTATSGSVYESPIIISETKTVKAIAIKDGLVTGVVSKTFTKSNGNPPETMTFSALYNTDTSVEGETINGTNFSVLFTKRNGGTDTKYYTNGTAVRWYGGGTLTVSAASGKTITGITINFTTHANAITANVGTYTDGSANGSGVWTGNASSVVFTQAGTSGQDRITSIPVTYE